MLSTGLSLRIPNRLGYNRIYQDTILPSASGRWTISGCFNHPALPLMKYGSVWKQVTMGYLWILCDSIWSYGYSSCSPQKCNPVGPPHISTSCWTTWSSKKMAENPTIWVSPNWGYLKKVSISIENKRHHQLWWPPIFRRTPIMLLALSHKYPLVSTITHS